jgi:hypothetical protein
MAEEKRDDGARDLIKLLLKEALAQHKNEMMENFSLILRQLPAVNKTTSTSSHFGGVTPFKIHVNFDIPLFEAQIDPHALEKWLNMLEGYYFVQKTFDIEKITFSP